MNYLRFSRSFRNSLQAALSLAILLLSFGPWGTSVAFAAPPPNDNFANALVVTGLSFDHSVSTVDATIQANEPSMNLNCDNQILEPGYKTVWYRYTASTKGIVVADTFGSDAGTPGGYDTYIAIWKGSSLSNLTFVTCDDHTAAGQDAQATFRTNPNVTYYIQVATFKCVVIGGDCEAEANKGGNLKFHMDIGGGPDTTGVFRPSNGALYLKNTNTTGFADIQINYGLPGDFPIVGDWDGNGTSTIGIYRNGSFYLRNNNTIGFADIVFPFGSPGDQPIAGDWNGDGVDTIGVYRNGTFFLRNSNSSGTPHMTFALGIPGDVGIAGDWNADGVDTTGVFRPSNGALYLKNTNTTGFADIQINYGLPGDFPVVGDWDGNGTSTIGIYRNGTFYLRNSNTIGFADIVFSLGVPGDMPIAGNWDGIP